MSDVTEIGQYASENRASKFKTWNDEIILKQNAVANAQSTVLLFLRVSFELSVPNLPFRMKMLLFLPNSINCCPYEFVVLSSFLRDHGLLQSSKHFRISIFSRFGSCLPYKVVVAVSVYCCPLRTTMLHQMFLHRLTHQKPIHLLSKH